MPEVVDWLKTLGMSEYAERFAERDIDFAILSDLTDQDLEKIGVASLGHRRKLLRAIANLEGIEKSGPVAAIAAARPATPRPADTAERRQVTVMFSDLVGSTALSARMDPEDLREVISAYQKCIAETVGRYGGFVAKYMGDGVLVYFGYPQAHEDDAERAVRAGLELIRAVGALKSSAPLRTRVGIATGLVVVGDLIGSGAAQEQAVVGETPNVAARLQALAEPNTVVVAESTRKLLGNLFELQDLGAKEVKGVAEPVRVWAAVRPSAVASRFEALHGGRLTALVGREEELELLLRRWSRAKTGEGQVVLLSGEAGIGKSRLTAALLERLAAEPRTRWRDFCSPQHTDSALYPTISQIERAAGLTHDDTPQAKLNKLDALLAQTSTSAHNAALLAEMLSLPNDGRYPALDLTPQLRRQETLEALVLQVVALSRQNPVLMIFEDAHWIDPTSLELFGRMVDKIPTLRVLLIMTFRTEFEPPWIGRPYVTALTINRLGERDISAMIDGVVGNKLLPANIRQDIIERTDGIPLFVEEMTKAVLEAESEGAAERAIGVVPSPALAVPASLHGPLMARLDRLGPAKEVAQVGAAIGREFSHALLATVVGKPEAELHSALDRLIAAGLLCWHVTALKLGRSRRQDPLQLFTVLYAFTTANIATFNGDVSRDLAADFLELAEKQKASFLLVLGHQLLGASLMYRGDLAEGRAHLDQGITLYDPAEHRPLATRLGRDDRVTILSHRSRTLWMLGYPEAALADANQALSEARESGQAATLMLALLHASFTHLQCGNYPTANAEIDELVALADKKDAAFWRTWGMLGRGWLLGLTGKASDAVQMSTSGITAWRSAGATLYLSSWLSYLAAAHAELGQLDDAWRCIEEAMTTVEATKERWFEAEVNRIAGEIALLSLEPDAEKARAYFDRALAVARRQQAKSWELRAAMSMARLWRDQGKRQEACDLLAPVYGWFTEGFDTLDLKEAKALLDELNA